MGPDFVPSDSNMSDVETSGQRSLYDLPCQTNNLPLSPCLTNENPSLIGINENIYIPSMNPDSLYDLATSYSTSETLDNMATNSTLFNYNQLDNRPEYDKTEQQTLDNNMTSDKILFRVENEIPSSATMKPRTRKISTESIDTVDSTSSDEIFNSTYTDTVSSTTSSAFLIKHSSDSEEETTQEHTIAPDACCCNDGYMSYSSTEVLNDDSDDAGSQEDLLLLNVEEPETEPDSESKPMLSEDNTEGVSISIEEDGGDMVKSLTDFLPRPLSPIIENEVVSFTIKEVEPKQYTKITDNLIVVDESFLFNSSTNLGDLEYGKNGKRAVTMQNLHERSSFLDLTEISKVGRVCQKALVYLKDDITMGSLVSLNTSVAKENNKDPFHQSLNLISGAKTEKVLKNTSSYMKNLIALSLSITLLYIAVGSVRNLQSSINHEGGVGVIGLAFNFVGYVVGSIFSSSIVQTFQPRRCLIANLFPNLLYIAANLYPALWVMVPISLIQGISLAVVANAVSTYITHLAKGCAKKTKETFAEVSCRFFGTYSLMYISHLIIGNLIASLILAPSSASFQIANATEITINSTLTNAATSANITDVPTNESVLSHLKKCGPNFCQHFDIGGSQFSVEMETKYFLFGVYIGCIVLALLIAIFFMEPLDASLFRSTVSPVMKLKSQLSSLTKFFVDVKFLLLLPLLMHSAMQFAFVTAEFAKGYITCALGIHMIGYTMICFGVCSSLSSFLCGLLNKFIGRIPFIVTAAILNLVCLIYMLKWLPNAESLVPYFVVMGLWGVTDGFWTAQVNSLMGVIFPDKFEEAYAGLRMTQGLSAAVTFGISGMFCMTAKIYICIGVCVAGLAGYSAMEGILRCGRRKPAILLKQTSV